MKFTYITGALLATLATAQPVTEEGTPTAVSPIAARTLQKRDDYRIAVWDNDNCSGGSEQYFGTASNNKGEFNGPKRSLKILQLDGSWHVTFYTGSHQSGVKTRFDTSNVGDRCWTGTFNGQEQSFLSFGAFAP